MRTLKHFIELELAKIEPQWTAEGKGSYWWGVKIGLETVLAKLCEMDGTVMVNAPQPERRQYDPHGSLSEYGIFPECDVQQRESSAPVGMEGFDEWFDEYTKNNYTDEMLAEAAWKAALTGMTELVELLNEVRSHFTRDDDLPDNLLPRIDAALADFTGEQ